MTPVAQTIVTSAKVHRPFALLSRLHAWVGGRLGRHPVRTTAPDSEAQARKAAFEAAFRADLNRLVEIKPLPRAPRSSSRSRSTAAGDAPSERSIPAVPLFRPTARGLGALAA